MLFIRAAFFHALLEAFNCATEIGAVSTPDKAALAREWIITILVHPKLIDRLANRFWGGAVGFFGYDVVRLIERSPDRRDPRRRRGVTLPAADPGPALP